MPGRGDVSQVVLASRSPRRRELLTALLGEARVAVSPPTNTDEAGFDDCVNSLQVEQRILEIASEKARQVAGNLHEAAGDKVIVAADTTVVVYDESGAAQVLGQPPDQDWQGVVRHWFARFYLHGPHDVITGIVVRYNDEAGNARQLATTVTTKVTFRQDAGDLVEWYLSTGESIGKAGGYGIQGAAAVFIEKLDGSLTNVIGLPLFETRQLLIQAGAITISDQLTNS